MTDQPDPTATRVNRAPARWRLAALGGAALVLVLGAAITLAASPTPSPAASPQATTDPDTDGWKGFGRRGGLGMFDGFAGFAGGRGGFGAGNIAITAIDGSSLSLETVDGWTRTITVTNSTTVTKNGEAIALSDLSVGDRIRFHQTVDDSGVYSVTAIDVVVPHVVGQVTAVDDDSMTLTQRDGSSVTVNVDGSTTYTVGGETGKSLADIEVGMVVAAGGEEHADGSFDAATIRAGSIWQGFGRGPGHGPWSGNPAPTATPDNSSNDG